MPARYARRTTYRTKKRLRRGAETHADALAMRFDTEDRLD